MSVHRLIKGSTAVSNPARFAALLLMPLHTSDFRFSRITKATSPSAIGWLSLKLSACAGSGRYSGGTIFWIRWGIFRYAVWLDK